MAASPPSRNVLNVIFEGLPTCGLSYLVLCRFFFEWCLAAPRLGSGFFAGTTAGRSELKVSATIFQVPSDCFFHTAISLALSLIGVP